MLLSPTRRSARLAESAANAVWHGRVPGRDFRLRLAAHHDGVLRIEVSDTRDDQMPCTAAPVSDAAHGRGLLIVEALADRWGVDRGPAPRKTVWA